MVPLLASALAVSLIINIAMFLLAYRLQSDKLTDISYTVTFIVLAGYGLSQSVISVFDLVLFGVVLLWAVRLGGFLLARVISQGKDSRFDGMRENFWRFAKFWVTQGLAVWVLMIPALLAFTSDREPTLWLLGAGLLVALTGLMIEAVADMQKQQFHQREDTKNQWIDEGLWRYARHPNYFGEILVWIGLYVYAVGQLSWQAAIVAIVSPLFISILLRFISGVPPLEHSAETRWGKNPRYRAYKRRTNLLVPLRLKRISTR